MVGTFLEYSHIESVKVANKYGLNVKHGYGEKTDIRIIFDLIISLGSFEHAYDINATFSEFNRILKNGNLILSGDRIIYWFSYITIL